MEQHELTDLFDDGPLALQAAIRANPQRFIAPMTNGLTPLFQAIAVNQLSALDVLLPISDLTQTVRNTLTANDTLNALMFAALMGSASCVPRLLQHLDPNAQSPEGFTALMLAAKEGMLHVVRQLLPVSDARLVDRERMDALMHAVEAYAPECVELLLPYSDLRARDSAGLTAFSLSTLRHNWACADLIAVHCPFEVAVRGLRKAPVGAVPRFHAHLERHALAQALGAPSTRPSPLSPASPPAAPLDDGSTPSASASIPGTPTTTDSPSTPTSTSTETPARTPRRI